MLLRLALTTIIAASAAASEPAGRLPEGTMPSIGAWFWSPEVFEPEGYKKDLDLFRDHATYDLLTVSVRLPGREVTTPEVHDTLKEAVAYAKAAGMDIAFELDVRLARKAFMEAHPDELQEMLRLRAVDLEDSGTATLRIESQTLRDHMNGRTTPYLPLAARLVRVYSFVLGENGIEPDTVEDITARCNAEGVAGEAVDGFTTIEAMEISIPGAPELAGRTACAMVAFKLLTPDVFAPHLLAFQRGIVEQYADVEMAGLMKDEWGFPPNFDGSREKNDFWHSEARAKAYAERTGGRDLVRDYLLMHLGERGRDSERQAVINHFLEMSRQRNAEIEDHYYALAKEFYGPEACVVTHPTWMPYPGAAEFKKNGLHWWTATRDFAQTDEGTPYAARTSLSKKWDGPFWVNQYYNTEPAAYEKNVWRHALGGGRINYHPLYPSEGARYRDLLRSDVMLAEARVRLLNLISQSPVHCPVAVIFGHANAMNWAGGAYADVGLALTDALWRAGYYADLIPSSEIGGEALRVNSEGNIQYGPQAYQAVVLYHPNFEQPETAAFFQKAAKGETAFYRVGDWTKNFAAEPFDGNAALPEAMQSADDAAQAVELVIAELRERDEQPHTPATEQTEWRAEMATAAPGERGQIRLIDGTRIMLSGAEKVAGDRIEASFDIDGREVTMDAEGVAAVRLDDAGKVEAFAAGGLQRLDAPGLTLELPQRADVAFWRDADGAHGVLQGDVAEEPEALKELTGDWRIIQAPQPLE